MTYYEKYNSFVLFLSLIGISAFLLIVFSRKTISLIDPITLHLISLASILALLLGYIFKYNFDENSFIFLLIYIIYIPSLFYFLKKNLNKNYAPLLVSSNSKLVILYIVSTFLVLFSRYDFISYAFISSPIEWFLFRYKLVEGRNPLQYICKIGATSFFYYYSFTLLSQKIWSKKIVIFFLILNLLIEIISGGRSGLINFIISYGIYLYKFPGYFSSNYLTKINIIGLIAVALSIAVAMYVTSMYSGSSSLEDGVSQVVDRILSAGDGLEMYLINHADKRFETGLFEYIKSALGIFVSNLFGIKSRSFGWRLYELDQGYDVLNSVGPNFILPLQVVVLSKYLLIPYTIGSAYLTAKLREFNLKFHPAFSYSIALNAFYLTTDIEYTLLIYVSTIFIYLLVFIPIIYLKIKIPSIRFIYSTYEKRRQ